MRLSHLPFEYVGELMRRIDIAPHAKALSALSVGLLAWSVEALAQTPPSVSLTAQSTAQAQDQRTFNVPPQPLQSGLIQFGQQAGRQIAVDGAIIRGLSTPGVQGTMSVEQALNRLLAGSGLIFTLTSGTTIAVHRLDQSAPDGTLQLDPVQVQGYAVPPQAMIDNVPAPYAGGQVATGGQLGLLGNRSVMDTPFNQTSYTARRVQDEQARSVRDVLADDPSVRGTWPTGSSSADVINIRGFNVLTSDMSYGGLYGILPYWSVAPQLAERVEVLKGPSAFLNGLAPSGSVGGTVNLVPKRAGNEPLTEATVSYSSAAQFGAAVDIGRRFGDDKQFGMRFNGVFRDGETAVQWNNELLGLGVLNLDFRGERVRIAIDAGYQDQRIDGLLSYLIVSPPVTIPTPPIGSRAYSQPWTSAQRNDLFGAIRGEFDISERWTAYASFGARDDRVSSLETTYASITNANGNFVTQPWIFRGFFNTQTAEAGVRGSFETGPIRHEVNLNATALWQQSGSNQIIGAAFVSNLYNPVFMPQVYLGFPIAPKTSDSAYTSFAFADTLSAANDRIQLTIGARQQNIDANNYTAGTGIWASNYNSSAFSPSVSLVFKPWSNVSLYGNYIQGLQPGTIVGRTFANAGQVLPPYVSKQLEVGAKVDWGKFVTTLSAFQITRPSAIANAATNTLNVNGEQRNQGIEFNTFGEPLPGVRLLGGFMLIDAVLAKTAGGIQDGWIANGVPGFQFNLGGEWDTPFVKGLTLNGRVLYTGAQYLNNTWPRLSIPEWARLDLGARYTFERAEGKPLTLRFNVENALDTNYYSSTANGIFVIQGAPRTFLVSLTTAF
jgi:iron complex outermembrane receptor protein